MRKLKSYEIRQMWLNFFASKGHEVVPSAPLVPVNDPTLLWINAGVAPLKKYFDGREIPKNKRMVNAQKSIRTNDIENVGKTARHHTFFEMLGNFSIGDYFRKEALEYAIEILTSPDWFGFDINKLYFTIYPDDIDSYNKWILLGVKEDHIIKLVDNFWEIGDGPCGPDTEIFFDRGEKYDPKNLGIKMLKEDIENDRYIEIWNIVFSQFNAETGKPRNEYKELPSKNIDTGMGLERMACVMQEVETNYDTDLFMPIINETEKITGVKYTGQMAFKVIADHIRSVTFAVSDGAILSNEGRGYVLRRILRRAVRYGKKLGTNTPFMYRLVDIVCDYMSNFYPYLLDTRENVKSLVKREEEKFLQTLETGEKKLVDYINDCIENNSEKIIKKDVAFLLYDTFGFPIELTLEVAQEYNFEVDLEGFKNELLKQKETSRNARGEEQSMNTQNKEMMDFVSQSEFVGYEQLDCSGKVIGIFKDGLLVDDANGEVLVVFDVTPFYAESGGQVGDIGNVILNDSTFKVSNTVKLPNLQHASLIDFGKNEVKVGDKILLHVNEEYRVDVSRNHSSTHLLNEALRKVLGKHVFQQGSSVTNINLRFDFNNFTNLSSTQILDVENDVNNEILKALNVEIKEMPIEEAKKMNVQAVFGEKYGDVVRVVTMGDSRELCGGTHVRNTSDIHNFVILSIESKGSGIFRIEASTGNHSFEELQKVLSPMNKEIEELKLRCEDIYTEAKKLNINLEYQEVKQTRITNSYASVLNKKVELNALRELVKELDKMFNKAKRENNSISLEDINFEVKNVGIYNIIITKTIDVDKNILKDLVDRISDKYDNSLVFIANIVNDSIVFICKSKIKELNAGLLVKEAAQLTKGNGGGRPDFAQAGGKDVSLVNDALDLIFTKTALLK